MTRLIVSGWTVIRAQPTRAGLSTSQPGLLWLEDPQLRRSEPRARRTPLFL